MHFIIWKPGSFFIFKNKSNQLIASVSTLHNRGSTVTIVLIRLYLLDIRKEAAPHWMHRRGPVHTMRVRVSTGKVST